MAGKRALLQAATAGGIGVAGDVCMQMLEGCGSLREADNMRSMRLAVFRTVQAPIVDQAWQVLDRVIQIPGLPGAAAKALADQTFIMPISMVCFFTSQGLMEGLSQRESFGRAKASLPIAAKASLPYWFSIHMVTFSVVPEHLRMLWASMSAVLWNVYMSHANKQAHLREAELRELGSRDRELGSRDRERPGERHIGATGAALNL
jgi:hypothetical protein